MKLKEIKILARVYPVQWMDDDWADDANIQGQHESAFNHHKIKIARKGGYPMGVLIHEIGHSIIQQCELIGDREEAEKIINVLMEQLLGVLRDNKINPLEQIEES